LPLNRIPPNAAVRRVAALLCAGAGLLATAPAAAAATRQVSATGADSGACLIAPCRTLGYAYGQAAAGDVVQVAAGSYPSQTIPGGTKQVSFRGAGAKLHNLDNGASNIRFSGFDVDAGFAKEVAFHSDGDNVTFANGRIGNVTDEKGALVSGSNLTFDGVLFHDVRLTSSLVHNECVYAIVTPGLTVRNSAFRACATMDLFFTYGDWWQPQPPGYGNVTLENNVFGHATMIGPASWHYYSLAVGHTGPPPGWGTIAGWVVRNNTFETPASIGDKTATGGSRWVGNVGDWTCIPGMTFRHNVGMKCHSTDRAVSPAGSTASVAAAFDWVNPAAFDFRLRAGSPAIGAADPGDHPALDRDGFVRDARPDAGAHEFGAGPPGAGGGGGPGGGPGSGPGGPAANGGGRSLIRSARLRPRVICRKPRGSCAGSALLRVRLARKARISVRVVRLRKGRPAMRVRTVKPRLRAGRRLRLRGRGLGPGRYHVVVIADRRGAKPVRRTLSLRVR
jgi:hypothetical protein